MTIRTLPVATVLCLAAITANAQAAEGFDHWPLQVAIDDGTIDNELFVELDHRALESGHHSPAQSGLARNGDRQITASKETTGGMPLAVDRQALTQSRCNQTIDDSWSGTARNPGYVAIQAVTVKPAVTISSERPIDTVSRDEIRAILRSAGHAEHIESNDSTSDDTIIEIGGDTM